MKCQKIKKTPKKKKSIKQSKNLNLCHWWRNARNSIIYKQWYGYVNNNAMNIQLIKAKHNENSKATTKKCLLFFFDWCVPLRSSETSAVNSQIRKSSCVSWFSLTHNVCKLWNRSKTKKKKKQDNECWWHDARCYTKPHILG